MMLFFVLLPDSQNTFWGIGTQIQNGLKVSYNDFIDWTVETDGFECRQII